jgi:glycerophosphoryl diester phosphodiesterase
VRPLRLAHRGDGRAAAENTIAAMQAALDVPGCDGLEFDVRIARDGTPVLLHDATLERVQGVASPVTELEVATLARLGVPTLAEVLAAVGREPFLDIELKAPANEELIRVVEAARGSSDALPMGSGSSARSGLHRAAISSFDPEVLSWVGARRPSWPRWLNSRELEAATIERAVDLGCESVAVLWRALDARSVAEARASGLDVIAWTVRRRPTFDRLARLGVSAICVEAAALDG